MTLGLSGCFTVETAKLKSDGSEHVVMNNFGWKLFNWIPLASGDASGDSVNDTTFFRDDVTLEKMQARFTAYAAGRRIDCPVVDANDTVFIHVFGIPIPYVLTYKELTISGTMK